MPTTDIHGIEQLRSLIGQEVATSDWLTISQGRIDQFAEVTEDRQWIHIDAERAERESPYGTTIAHGFLTLSLLSALISQAIEMHGFRMGVNYGFNRVRFTAPVPAGSNIRARFTLNTLDEIPNGVQITWGVVVEAEGATKPCCVADWITRRYA
ncbi:MAG: MaoC family dehydratase [Chloroflexi bacterium]|nr:MaoC family dehydratase [Chloroflexota bacterium]